MTIFDTILLIWLSQSLTSSLEGKVQVTYGRINSSSPCHNFLVKIIKEKEKKNVIQVQSLQEEWGRLKLGVDFVEQSMGTYQYIQTILKKKH